MSICKASLTEITKLTSTRVLTTPVLTLRYATENKLPKANTYVNLQEVTKLTSTRVLITPVLTLRYVIENELLKTYIYIDLEDELIRVIKLIFI